MDVLRDRLASRTGDIADATADLLEAQQADYQPFTEMEQSYVKTLDTSQPLEPQLQFWFCACFRDKENFSLSSQALDKKD